MRTILLALLMAGFQADPSAWAGGNTLDDMFTVRKIDGPKATAEGKLGSLKAGDNVYYVKSPFQFTLDSAKDGQIVFTVPKGTEIKVGSTVLRNLTDDIKRAMKTENRLKQAADD